MFDMVDGGISKPNFNLLMDKYIITKVLMNKLYILVNCNMLFQVGKYIEL